MNFKITRRVLDEDADKIREEQGWKHCTKFHLTMCSRFFSLQSPKTCAAASLAGAWNSVFRVNELDEDKVFEACILSGLPKWAISQREGTTKRIGNDAWMKAGETLGHVYGKSIRLRWLCGKKTMMNKHDYIIECSIHDTYEMKIKQYHQLRQISIQLGVALLIHQKNHYSLIMGFRELTDAYGNIIYQINAPKTGKKKPWNGQQPKFIEWTNWFDMHDLFAKQPKCHKCIMLMYKPTAKLPKFITIRSTISTIPSHIMKKKKKTIKKKKARIDENLFPLPLPAPRRLRVTSKYISSSSIQEKKKKMPLLMRTSSRKIPSQQPPVAPMKEQRRRNSLLEMLDLPSSSSSSEFDDDYLSEEEDVLAFDFDDYDEPVYNDGRLATLSQQYAARYSSNIYF